jgi:hypothetical protein
MVGGGILSLTQHQQGLLRVLQQCEGRSIPQAFSESFLLRSNREVELISIGAVVERLDTEDPLRSGWEIADHQARTLDSQGCFSVDVFPDVNVSSNYGIVDTLSASIDALVRCAEKCLPLSAFPFVDRLVLYATDELFSEFLQLPLLERFREVRFYEIAINDEKMQQLLVSHHVSGVLSWDFDCGGDFDKQELIDQCEIMSHVAALAVSNAPVMSSCEALNLGYNSFGVEGITALANSKHLGNLRTLVCSDSEFGDEGLEVIASAPGFPSLRSLGCGYNQLTPAGVRRLFSGPVGQQLISVALHSSRFASGIGFPLESLKDAPLRHVHMNFCDLRPEGLSELMESEAFPDLRSLSLKRNVVCGGFASIFSRPRPIRKVDASRNGINDEAVEEALAKGHADNLEWLDLSENQFTDRAARALSANPQLAKLEVLHLTGNQINDDGSRHLRESSVLQNLKLLYLSGAMLSEAERERLVQRFGEGVIFR